MDYVYTVEETVDLGVEVKAVYRNLESVPYELEEIQEYRWSQISRQFEPTGTVFENVWNVVGNPRLTVARYKLEG